jgi:hypothetical protein
MNPLSQTLLADDDRREKLIGDCVRLVEERVASRGPIRRIALSAGIGLLNAIKPNALHRAVGKLLPDFADALEPLYGRFGRSDHADFSPFLRAHSEEATAALLAVTDRRVGASANAGLRSMYARLRGTAEGEVRDALPGLATILSDHLSHAARS